MKLVISKYIGQLRYIPTMKMYESLFRIATTLADSDDFEHWKAKRTPDSVLLFDNKKKISLEVSSNNLTFTTENETLGNKLNSEVIKYSTLFLEKNDIEKFNRIGIRKVGIYELSINYSDFLNKFINAFLKDQEEMKSILADDFNDTAYIIESAKDGYSVRMQMAPFKPDQFDNSPHFPKSDYTPDNPLKNPTNFILDVDIYRNQEDGKLSYDDMLSHVNNSFKQMTEIYESVLNLVKDKTK